MRHRLICLSIAFLCPLSSLRSSAQQIAPASISPTDSLVYRTPTQSFVHSLRYSLPVIGVGALANWRNKDIRTIRNEHIPNFRYHFDDYLQFAPLVAQIGLRLGGLKGSSKSLGQQLSADAMATAFMLSTVYVVKTMSKVQRPDGSSHNSFPSGHTAMAFTSATLLNIEYGDRYPWIGAIGYATAAASGVGRLMNNRHWVGDVVTGAGVGILSGHLGYMLSDLLWGQPQRSYTYKNTPLDRRGWALSLNHVYAFSAPIRVGDQSIWFNQRAIRLGAEYSWGNGVFGALGLIGSKQSLGIEGAPEAETISFPSMALSMASGMHISFPSYGITISPALRMGVDIPTKSPKEHPSWQLNPHAVYSLGGEIAVRYRFAEHLSLRVALARDYQMNTMKLTYQTTLVNLKPWVLQIGTGLEVNL